LDEHETLIMMMKEEYFEYSDIKEMFENGVRELDPLYLIKWRNLSYSDLTWEPLSAIKVNEK
jgi:hypothetical protein